MGENSPLKIGIYDFFAYTIPGVFYLFTIAYLCGSFGLITIDFQLLTDLSLIGVFVIALLAYITGLTIDRIASFWGRLFKAKNLAQIAFHEFQLIHSDLNFKFQAKDWPILLAYLRRENIGATTEIERFNVMYIMLRNVSLNLVALSIVEIVQYIRTNFVIWHLVSSLVLVVLSILAGQQGAKFNKWFYSANFEAIIAHALEPSNLLTHKEETTSTPKG